jgi:NADH-ubiquinone oxidoreductase chain 4L
MAVILKRGFIFYIYVIGIISFVSRRKHLLSTLLSLEFIVLCLFFILIYFLNLIKFEVYFSIIFLTFRVCEGALGVSILVSIIRTHGNDYFNSFSILQC